jgi:hypothetical protein
MASTRKVDGRAGLVCGAIRLVWRTVADEQSHDPRVAAGRGGDQGRAAVWRRARGADLEGGVLEELVRGGVVAGFARVHQLTCQLDLAVGAKEFSFIRAERCEVVLG